MRVLDAIEEVRQVIRQGRAEGCSVGLVPTMGYFHEGHLSLMRQARKDNDLLVVSIFVNPAQFGPKEDFNSYPRDVERDYRMASDVGADLIFNPSVGEMYPEGYHTYVNVEELTDGLCGASRPGHFRGVTTVVAKLFNIVQPDRAYFGRKDYQQLKVIERMVKDLDFPIEIIGMPIVREPDGLAMSSRNVRLNPDEREAALILSKSLAYAQELLDEGVTSASEIKERVEQFIGSEPLAHMDYAAVVHPETLEAIQYVEDQAVLAIAARIGSKRLIDNKLIHH